MAVFTTTAASLWIALAAAIAAAGGTAIVAETSAPGDVLYTVKTNVNERILGSLALSAAADARWESTLAVRRAKEAAELAADGNLSAEARSQLQAEFESHSRAAMDAAKDLAAEGNADVAAEVMAEFATELSAEEDAIRGMVNLDGDARAQLGIMSALITATQRNAARAKENFSAKANMEAEAEGSLKVEGDNEAEEPGDDDTNDEEDQDNDDDTSAGMNGSAGLETEGGVRVGY